MRKKIGIVTTVLLLTIIFSGCGKTENSSTPATATPLPTIVATKMIEWEDPAGFIFEYPEGLNIDNHPEDQVNYANLEITDQQENGKILIMAKDTKYTDVGAWIKTDKSLKDGTFEDTILSGLKAKKIALVDGRVIVGTIDDAILFTIEGDFSKSQKLATVFEKIVESFKMVIPEAVKEKTTTSDGGSNLDIEEIGIDEE